MGSQGSEAGSGQTGLSRSQEDLRGVYVSTRRSSTNWSIRPFEDSSISPHLTQFKTWVSSGERDDYAAVRIIPPLSPYESGANEVLEDVILAPRHAGVSLRHIAEYPVHVYVLTSSPGRAETKSIPPEEFSIRIWAVLEAAI